jgi:hypothetical protein
MLSGRTPMAARMFTRSLPDPIDSPRPSVQALNRCVVQPIEEEQDRALLRNQDSV